MTAYLALWLGLEFVAESVTDSPTVGHGVLATVRWHGGEPAGLDFSAGRYTGVKSVVGDMLYEGVFCLEEALDYLQGQVI